MGAYLGLHGGETRGPIGVGGLDPGAEVGGGGEERGGGARLLRRARTGSPQNPRPASRFSL